MMKAEAVVSPDDIRAVEDLAGTIWNESYRGIISQEQIDYMLEEFQSYAAIKKSISSGYLYYIITLDDKRVGYIGVLPENRKLFLSKIYVCSKYRRNGIASFAIGCLKEMAFEKRWKSIYLTVNKNNTGSIEFYKKIGFRIASEKIADIGNGFVMDDYVMELRL